MDDNNSVYPMGYISYMIGENIGYMKLNRFSATTIDEVSEHLNSLRHLGASKLIVDLRGNPGGLLDEAVGIVNMFVTKGTKVVEMKGREAKSNLVFLAKEKPTDLEIPIVVLIDKGSASASEIVSGTLQDLDRAVVVGTQSFGKGLVQQTINMEYNSILKYTTAKYYTPSGRCIQRLDYSERKTTGKGSTISDTLVNSFTTKNGRPVTDGRGISPDVEIDNESISPLSISLLNENIIFDFATNYFYNHKEIVAAKSFELNEQDYSDFEKFALDKEFKYTTGSEKILEGLMDMAKEERYYASSKTDFDNLVEKLSPNKTRDLKLFKDEIKELLESEIIGRYYYQKGQVSYNLQKDKVVGKAIEILNNKTEYSSLLNPVK